MTYKSRTLLSGNHLIVYFIVLYSHIHAADGAREGVTSYDLVRCVIATADSYSFGERITAIDCREHV